MDRRVTSLTVDVGEASPKDRLGNWTDALYEHYYPLDLTNPSLEFNVGRLGIFEIPNISFGSISSDPMNVYRRRQHVQHGGDYYFVPMPQRQPIRLRQSGREATLRPGDFTVIATADTYQYQQETQNDIRTLRIDGPRLRERIPMIDDLVAQTCSADTPVVRLFTEFAGSILQHGHGMSDEVAAAMSHQVLDLLALAVTEPVDALQSRESAVRRAHHRRIIRAIETHIANSALGPRLLSEELGLSERYIQKMFHERGETLSGVIRARRIATAQRRLLDPIRRSSSIAAIGFSVGFQDPAYFSRAFKLETGLSPSAFRERENEPTAV